MRILWQSTYKQTNKLTICALTQRNQDTRGTSSQRPLVSIHRGHHSTPFAGCAWTLVAAGAVTTLRSIFSPFSRTAAIAHDSEQIVANLSTLVQILATCPGQFSDGCQHIHVALLDPMVYSSRPIACVQKPPIACECLCPHWYWSLKRRQATVQHR